ncbi:MAG: hypothetical protein M0002_19795 [Rhodospirillales bacterium]|nr:hypothetical protein [Rhodospirillales bacterium]
MTPAKAIASATVTVGVNISKDHLHVAVHPVGETRRFGNTRSGHTALLRWIGQHDPRGARPLYKLAELVAARRSLTRNRTATLNRSKTLSRELLKRHARHRQRPPP